MPYVLIQTGAALSPQTRQEIAAALGEAVTVIPGKNAGNLMLTIDAGADMVFAGKKTDECLYMDIRLHGAAAMDAKEKLVVGCYRLLTKATGMEANNIYITIQEFPKWGALGSYL